MLNVRYSGNVSYIYMLGQNPAGDPNLDGLNKVSSLRPIAANYPGTSSITRGALVMQSGVMVPPNL